MTNQVENRLEKIAEQEAGAVRVAVPLARTRGRTYGRLLALVLVRLSGAGVRLERDQALRLARERAVAIETLVVAQRSAMGTLGHVRDDLAGIILYADAAHRAAGEDAPSVRADLEIIDKVARPSFAKLTASPTVPLCRDHLPRASTIRCHSPSLSHLRYLP